MYTLDSVTVFLYIKARTCLKTGDLISHLLKTQSFLHINITSKFCQAGTFVRHVLSVLEMSDGRRNNRLLMEAFEDDSSSSSVSALQHPALLSEWIHPADWSFSFRGSRLRSDSYQSSQQLSICQIDSITAALLLWCGSVSIRSCSLGLWRRWLLLMFSCHWLPFHRAVSQRWEASYGTSPDREIDTNTVRTHLVSAPAQEMKTVRLTGWRVRMKTVMSKQTGSEINTWQITVTTNSQLTVQHRKLKPNVTSLLSEVNVKQQSGSLWL